MKACHLNKVFPNQYEHFEAWAKHLKQKHVKEVHKLFKYTGSAEFSSMYLYFLMDLRISSRMWGAFRYGQVWSAVIRCWWVWAMSTRIFPLAFPAILRIQSSHSQSISGFTIMLKRFEQLPWYFYIEMFFYSFRGHMHCCWICHPKSYRWPFQQR